MMLVVTFVFTTLHPLIQVATLTAHDVQCPFSSNSSLVAPRLSRTGLEYQLGACALSLLTFETLSGTETYLVDSQPKEGDLHWLHLA